LCRLSCLPNAGCPLATPFACYGRKVLCTTTEAACRAGSSFNAATLAASQRRLLQSTPLAGEEACVDCQNAIPALRQDVVLSCDCDTFIDVLADTTGVPCTQLLLPAGAILARRERSRSRCAWKRCRQQGCRSPAHLRWNSTPFKLSVLAASSTASSSRFRPGSHGGDGCRGQHRVRSLPAGGRPVLPAAGAVRTQGDTYAVSADASVHVTTNEDTDATTRMLYVLRWLLHRPLHLVAPVSQPLLQQPRRGGRLRWPGRQRHHVGWTDLLVVHLLQHHLERVAPSADSLTPYPRATPVCRGRASRSARPCACSCNARAASSIWPYAPMRCRRR